MPQRREGLGARVRGVKSATITTIIGRRGYVPLAFCWRCGLGMMPPHSTQRTMPAPCSSSETESEITRLCVQVRGGLFLGV